MCHISLLVYQSTKTNIKWNRWNYLDEPTILVLMWHISLLVYQSTKTNIKWNRWNYLDEPTILVLMWHIYKDKLNETDSLWTDNNVRIFVRVKYKMKPMELSWWTDNSRFNVSHFFVSLSIYKDKYNMKPMELSWWINNSRFNVSQISSK